MNVLTISPISRNPNLVVCTMKGFSSFFIIIEE